MFKTCFGETLNCQGNGGALKEALKENDLSQRELALRTGVTEAYISSIINGRKLLTPAYAKKLEHVLGYQAIRWLTLQAEHELSMLQFQSCQKESRKETGVVKKLGEIVAFLKDRQVIEEHSADQNLINDLRSLLKVADLMLIPEVLKASDYPLPPSKKADPYILYAWLAICESLAVAKEEDRSFDITALDLKTEKLKEAANSPVNYYKLQQILPTPGRASPESL